MDRENALAAIYEALRNPWDFLCDEDWDPKKEDFEEYRARAVYAALECAREADKNGEL